MTEKKLKGKKKVLLRLIQKITGKLGQKLRTYDKNQGFILRRYKVRIKFSYICS